MSINPSGHVQSLQTEPTEPSNGQPTLTDLSGEIIRLLGEDHSGPPSETPEIALIRSYVSNPSSIPHELVAASLTRLLDADTNKLQEELRAIMDLINGGTGVQKFILDTLVRTWADENGLRIVEDKNVTPHIREARQLLKEQKDQGKFLRAIAVILGKDQVTFTELIQMAEQLAAENAELEMNNGKLRAENMGLQRERATITTDAAKAAEQIISEARALADKTMSDASKAAEEILAKASTQASAITLSAARQVELSAEELARLNRAKEALNIQTPDLLTGLVQQATLEREPEQIVMNSAKYRGKLLCGAVNLDSPDQYFNTIIEIIREAQSIQQNLGVEFRNQFLLACYQEIEADVFHPSNISKLDATYCGRKFNSYIRHQTCVIFNALLNSDLKSLTLVDRCLLQKNTDIEDLSKKIQIFIDEIGKIDQS